MRLDSCPVCGGPAAPTLAAGWDACPCSPLQRGPSRGEWWFFVQSVTIGKARGDQSGARHYLDPDGSSRMLSWGSDGVTTGSVPPGSMRGRIDEVVRLAVADELMSC